MKQVPPESRRRLLCCLRVFGEMFPGAAHGVRIGERAFLSGSPAAVAVRAEGDLCNLPKRMGGGRAYLVAFEDLTKVLRIFRKLLRRQLFESIL